jgi:hypothetical protein
MSAGISLPPCAHPKSRLACDFRTTCRLARQLAPERSGEATAALLGYVSADPRQLSSPSTVKATTLRSRGGQL